MTKVKIEMLASTPVGNGKVAEKGSTPSVAPGEAAALVRRGRAKYAAAAAASGSADAAAEKPKAAEKISPKGGKG